MSCFFACIVCVKTSAAGTVLSAGFLSLFEYYGHSSVDKSVPQLWINLQSQLPLGVVWKKTLFNESNKTEQFIGRTQITLQFYKSQLHGHVSALNQPLSSLLLKSTQLWKCPFFFQRIVKCHEKLSSGIWVVPWRQTQGEIGTTKLTVVYRVFSNAPNPIRTNIYTKLAHWVMVLERTCTSFIYNMHIGWWFWNGPVHRLYITCT
jgi:hypothetical protein